MDTSPIRTGNRLNLGRALRIVAATLLATTMLVFATSAAPPSVSAGVDDGWEMIDVGDGHSCGVTTVNEIFCWGGGSEGQLGDGTTNTLLNQLFPLEVAAPAGVTWASVDTGGAHTCATTTDGDIYCWGVDDEGRLGNGNTAVDDFFPSPTLVDRPAGVSWASVTAAGSHTCALTTNGEAYCFGENDRGQLGVGDENPRNTPTPVLLPAGIVVDSIEVGTGVGGLFDSRTTCVVSTVGAGYCWGSDELGALGDGPGEVNSNVPVAVAVPGGGAWATIRPGWSHDLRCHHDRRRLLLGRDQLGQLGNGSADSGDLTPQPVSTPAGASWSTITPSTTFTCGVTTGGARCTAGVSSSSAVSSATARSTRRPTTNPTKWSHRRPSRPEPGGAMFDRVGPTAAPSTPPERAGAGVGTATGPWVTMRRR